MTSTLPPPLAVDATPGARPWRIRPGAGILAAVGIGGVAFDLGVRHPVGLMSVLAVALTAVGCVVGGWSRDRPSAILLGFALVPASFLMIRQSAWLVPLDIVAVVGLLVLAAAVRPEPDPLGRAAGRLLNPLGALEPALWSADLLARSGRDLLRGHDTVGARVVRLVRGIVIGAPIAAALIFLLAASDALFRSWVTVPLEPTAALGHVLLAVVGAALMAGVAGHGAWAAHPAPTPPRRFLGPTEATVILVGVVGVYLAFVVAQVVAITGGAAYVQRTTGLTYKDYARAGFFQLVAAAVITLAVLVIFSRHRRDAAPRAARRLLVLEETTVVLTLVVVGVAIRRLFLYEAEFGLTMLRLYTIVFAGFIGVVFVVVGLSLAGRLRAGSLAVVATVAFGFLVAMNIVNPEAIVADRNLDRFGGTPDLDVDYLVESLGADAIPTLLRDDATAARLCGAQPDFDDRLVTFNLGRHRAAAAISRTCGG